MNIISAVADRIFHGTCKKGLFFHSHHKLQYLDTHVLQIYSRLLLHPPGKFSAQLKAPATSLSITRFS